MSGDGADRGLEALLDHIRRSRGFDFTGYKRPSLQRRIAKRLDEVGVSDPAEYLDYLEVHPEEFALLFDTILINVTGFFRDAAAWRHLREATLPRLLTAKGPDDPVRVWSAGCASGEEAYSLAMLLADALGEDAARERVKIYATDVDEDSLSDARQALYPLKVADDIPPELAERFLERTDARYTFRKDLRGMVIFGRNDLVQDAPISRVDLLACRNTLMYFNAETQTRILGRFHFALTDPGVLFLGKSEMLITHHELFRPLELRHRLFAKVPRRLAPRLGFPVADLGGEAGDQGAADSGLRELAWDMARGAEVVLDADGQLALANHEARRMFGLTAADLGRRFSDLELAYRPVELRSAIKQAAKQRAPVEFGDVEHLPAPDQPRRLEVRVSPLLSGGGSVGTSIAFHDLTEQRELQDALERSKRELEVAYEELQSTVEELETTNEELQSTNEELETMNEELQSTNQELESVNDELQQRGADVNRLNAFLETILTAMELGVVALDREGVIRLWNPRSEDLWGVREEEALGHHLLTLDVGLPTERLSAPLSDVLAADHERLELELDATNRRGQPIRCRVVLMPLGTDGRPRGSLILVEQLER